MVSASSALVPEDPLLWGRDTELSRFEGILSQGKPALVVIEGERLVTSALLGAFRDRAEERGWKVLLADGGSGLSVTPQTTEKDFCQQVRRLLDILAAERLEKAQTQPALLEETLLPRTGGKGTETDPPVVEDAAKPLVMGLFPKRAVEIYSQRGSSLEDLVLQLGKLALQGRGIFLPIDSYQSAVDFQGWFTGRFLGDIKRLGAAVIVVAGVPDGVDSLTSADEIIHLGPPDLQSVREEFEMFGQTLSPRIEPKELGVYLQYLQEAATRFDRLHNLVRVLRLAQPGEPER